MSSQAPHSIIMIRPANFGYNVETAKSNSFQNSLESNNIESTVLAEFDGMVRALRSAGIAVDVYDDSPLPIKPDAVFPNNWFSTHPDGKIITYPMLAENRRLERRQDIIETLTNHYQYSSILDWTHHENEQRFLEGTGSIIFDHIHKTAYACESPRTDIKLLEQLCAKIGYLPISFQSHGLDGTAIYHTNVMLSIGEDIALVCAESIPFEMEKRLLLKALKKHHKVIELDFSQMNQFACNCLEVERKDQKNALVMSTTAKNSLRIDQIEKIEDYLEIVAVTIPTIETIGGGSARCMMAGIHLKK